MIESISIESRQNLNGHGEVELVGKALLYTQGRLEDACMDEVGNFFMEFTSM